MQDEGYIRIPLRRHDGTIRGYALVDDDDAQQARFRWSWKGGYAIRYVGTPPNQRRIIMHREVLGLGRYADDPRQVDHINGDTLDNRRFNLRVVTKAQNAQNLKPRRDGSSAHRGVGWHCGKWRAYVTLNGKQHHLGRFENEEDAAAAAVAFRAQHMPFVNERRATWESEAA